MGPSDLVIYSGLKRLLVPFSWNQARCVEGACSIDAVLTRQ
jgi:hypothetical protein